MQTASRFAADRLGALSGFGLSPARRAGRPRDWRNASHRVAALTGSLVNTTRSASFDSMPQREEP